MSYYRAVRKATFVELYVFYLLCSVSFFNLTVTHSGTLAIATGLFVLHFLEPQQRSVAAVAGRHAAMEVNTRRKHALIYLYC